MASLNKVTLIGRLGKDPHSSDGSKKIVRFSICTGSDKSQMWHNVVCFDKTAELAEKFLRKGSLVYLEGPLSSSSYEKDGVKRTSTSVIANHLQFLSPKDKSIEESKTTAVGDVFSIDDLDVPF